MIEGHTHLLLESFVFSLLFSYYSRLRMLFSMPGLRHRPGYRPRLVPLSRRFQTARYLPDKVFRLHPSTMYASCLCVDTPKDIHLLHTSWTRVPPMLSDGKIDVASRSQWNPDLKNKFFTCTPFFYVTLLITHWTFVENVGKFVKIRFWPAHNNGRLGWTRRTRCTSIFIILKYAF